MYIYAAQIFFSLNSEAENIDVNDKIGSGDTPSSLAVLHIPAIASG